MRNIGDIDPEMAVIRRGVQDELFFPEDHFAENQDPEQERESEDQRDVVALKEMGDRPGEA